MEADKFDEVIGGKRYSTADSVKIAKDAYGDEPNWKRRGRNWFLFRTKNGDYFSVTRSRWGVDRDAPTPLSQDDAIKVWEELPVHLVTFEEAFPGVTVEDA
jgi:hypothetical protein